MVNPDLVAARKSCRICTTRNPGKIHAGAEFEFDPSVVSYWSQWLGHARPKILVVGQDFGDIGYFKRHKGMDEAKNQTNNFLFKLLRQAGLNPTEPPAEDKETPVYLTNSILCLKEPPMNSPVRETWIEACAIQHLRPLIMQLRPPIMIAMGAPAWKATQLALELRDVPIKLSEAVGRMFRADSGIQVFPVGHCGWLGQRNRSLATQREDWSRIGEALKPLLTIQD